MLAKILAALVYSFTHPNLSVAAVEATTSRVVTDTQKVAAGLQDAHDVVSALPDGNTKTAALNAIVTASALTAQAIGVANTVSEGAQVVGMLTGGAGATPAPA